MLLPLLASLAARTQIYALSIKPLCQILHGTDETREKGQRAVRVVTAERLDSWYTRDMALAATSEAA